MKKIRSSKLAVTLVVLVTMLSVFSAGVLADNAYKKITAYQNPEITITVDGKTVDLSSEEGMMYPLIYDGHSYVSARALAEAMGGTVHWNDVTQTVEVTTGSKAVPDKDSSSNPKPKPSPTPAATSKPQSSSPAKSSHAGTLSDPIPLGSSFTYTESSTYNEAEYGSYSVKYEVAVKSAQPITRSQIADLGFSEPEAKATIEYMLVELAVKVSDAKMKAGSDTYSKHKYLSSYTPYTWGSKTSDDSGSIIGGTDHGFEGSLSTEADEAAGDRKVTPGVVEGYEFSGKIILPVIKGQTNYLVLENQTTGMDYDASFIYFKLK